MKSSLNLPFERKQSLNNIPSDTLFSEKANTQYKNEIRR